LKREKGSKKRLFHGSEVLREREISIAGASILIWSEGEKGGEALKGENGQFRGSAIRGSKIR